ncbi:HAD family hydrolase [Paenibacillus illinoisensis]|uniref:HAD family hydrolase n=1 Tax=Paenibacillus illinoisensis TaxID=59845 RepID=UPI001C8F138F|nr:HAD hydrolase-like protein [Paenibacillus illinoisensis]MBY0220370.1 HAD family hydrolase [Paenibacillus illinoisensis]
MMKNKIFMDYDGTIVSNQKRLFRFFIDYLPKDYKNILTEEEFWCIKVLGIHEIEWVNNVFNLGIDKYAFDKCKAKKIEEMNYLKYNQLFTYSIPVLERLQLEYDLFLVTRRSNSSNLIREIQENGVIKYFKEIIIVPHKGYDCKSTHVLGKCEVSADDIFVGDTEDDLRAGLKLGANTYFVKSGIRREWMLKKCFPEHESLSRIHVIDNIGQLSSLDFE